MWEGGWVLGIEVGYWMMDLLEDGVVKSMVCGKGVGGRDMMEEKRKKVERRDLG